jgi:hypothetical protein
VEIPQNATKVCCVDIFQGVIISPHGPIHVERVDGNHDER